MVRAIVLAGLLAASFGVGSALADGGRSAEAASVPGPLVGLGLPGVLAAVGYVMWRRSRTEKPTDQQ